MEERRTNLATRVLAMLLAAAGLLLTMSAASFAAGSVLVQDINHGPTPEALAKALTGNGVTVSNVTYTGSGRSLGAFTNGAASIGIEDGVVLGTGKVQTYPTDEPCSQGVEGPNTCFNPTPTAPAGGPSGFDNSSALGFPGDAQLTELVGYPTFDAAVLEFDFVAHQPTVDFDYVFASEEYDAFANTKFDDAFGFYVNGANCALVPHTGEPVSVDTINGGTVENEEGEGSPTPHNPALFRDNVNPQPTIDSQFNGLTTVLTCEAAVKEGQANHVKLAIADASDEMYDSGAFISDEPLAGGPEPTTLTTLLQFGKGVEDPSGEKVTVEEGQNVEDKATLEGPHARHATGTITYDVYSDPECKDLVAQAGTVEAEGIAEPPSEREALAPGTYYWQASYSGDEANAPSESECGSEVETVTPGPQPTTLTTSLSGGGRSGPQVTVGEGTAVSDTATLAGANAASATGTVAYAVYSDSECKDLVAEAGSAKVAGSAVPASSAETLAPGTYYWQASYGGDEENDPSKSQCGSEVETVTAAGAGGPSVEAECFTHSNVDSVITTHTPGDLLVAFVSANSPATGGQVAKVTGGGLKWKLVARENGQLGDSEVWEARAKGLLTKAAFSIKLSRKFYDAVLDVVAFKNASGVGASGGFDAPAGPPTGTIATTAPSSWVWGVGNDWAASIPRTPGPGQSVRHEGFDAGGDTYWVQSTDAVTPLAGTPVTIDDTAPTADPYNLVLVEIL
jgi:hypothetical protein